MSRKTARLFFLAMIMTVWFAHLPVSAETRRCYNRERSCSIELPGDWQVLENIPGAAIAAVGPAASPAGRFRENITVVIDCLTKPAALEEYFERILAEIRVVAGDIQEHGNGQLSIDGAAARWFAYTQRLGQVNVTVVLYILLKQDRAYVITCAAAPDDFISFSPIFEGVARSFRTESGFDPATAGYFSVGLEQDGKRVEIKDHEARLRRGSFAVLLFFREPDGVYVNASFYPDCYQAAREGKPLFAAVGAELAVAEPGFNPDKVVFMGSLAVNYWYFAHERDHRFDSVTREGDRLVCVRTVQNYRYKQDGIESVGTLADLNQLYLVLVKTKRGLAPGVETELQREFLKVVFSS